MNLKIRTFLNHLFFIFLTLVFLQSGLSQESSRDQNKIEPLSEHSKQWLEEVVPYIITSGEKDVFKNLPTEADRGKFIDNFWGKRDPDPKTPENEFKLDYYRRIAYANKFFGAGGIEGWRTERGRIFILLGPPSEIQRDMSPRDYGYQTAFHGPKETWSYWGLPNPRLPYNLEFVFVDKFGSGNYVLEQSLRLMQGGMKNFNLDETHYYFDYMEFLSEATRNPFEGLDRLRGIVTTQVSYDQIPIEYDSLNLRDSAETTLIPMTLRIPFSALTPKDGRIEKHFSLTVMVIVSNELGQIIFERSTNFDFKHSSAEFETLKNRTHRIQLSLSLEPEAHKIHLLVLDNNSGKVGTVHKEFQVTDFRGEDLIMSDIVLTSSKQIYTKYATPTENMIANEISTVFRVGDEMNIHVEVYNLSPNGETELQDFEAEYEFLQNGKSLVCIPGISEKNSKNKDVQIKTSFRLKNFIPGVYILRVKVNDRNSGQQIEKDTVFTVTQ